LDINPGSAGSSPTSFTQVNNLTFFVAGDVIHGRELWASDGTTAGTHLVRDIAPGLQDSSCRYLTNVNGTLFFEADDFIGSDSFELWKSDGTAAGTVMLTHTPGVDFAPRLLTNVNGTLFFQANDGSHGQELWKSNGTPAGTSLVKDIDPGSAWSSPTNLTNVNGTLFFSATDGTNGFELWKSDGTAAGTVQVSDINSGFASSYPTDLTQANLSSSISSFEPLFLQAKGFHGTELWASNGTPAGTFLVDDIQPGPSGSYPHSLTNVNGTLFFVADDGTDGPELWRTNGTFVSTKMVLDIFPGATGSNASYLTNVNGTLFFSATDGVDGNELWKSDGTAAGTQMVLDIDPGIDPGSGNAAPSGLTNVNGTLFFSAYDGTHGFELWKSDGSVAGTTLVQDINPLLTGSYPLNLANVSGALFFTANDGTHGVEPWILPVSTLSTTSVSSSPNPAGPGLAVTFTATIGVAPGAGSPTGTVDFKEGSTDLTPGGVALTGNQATFTTAALAVGIHSITAIYSGDSTFTGSQGDDSSRPQVVIPDATTTTVLAAPSSLISGQSVVFFAVVSNVSGLPGVPTGTVQFAVDGTNLGSPVTLVSGAAPSITTQLTALGSPHTVTATYINSDGNFHDNSRSLIQAVSKAGTSTTLISTPNPAVFGQAVVFTATVGVLAPGGGTPTGTVDFKEGATDLTPGGITLSNARATFSTATLTLGHHTITAAYSGDANYTASQADDSAAPQVVNQASSRTVLLSFPNPAVFGQVVSFTVNVSALQPGKGTPTGTVTFTDGATTIGSISLSGGRATFTTSSLGRGAHAISASYAGDSSFLASAYSNFGEVVQRDATTTTVAASANPAVVGQPLTLTAQVQAGSPGSGKPTGTVTFKDITTVLGTGTLNAVGQATFTTSSLTVGTHALTATYAGDNNFISSVSPIIAEVVKASANLAVGKSTPQSSSWGAASIGSLRSTPGHGLSAQSLNNFFGSSAAQHQILRPRLGRPRPLVSDEEWVGDAF
jgi:ELWxxDGT repeat protein